MPTSTTAVGTGTRMPAAILELRRDVHLNCLGRQQHTSHHCPR
eukprot:COSAG05_NODE_10101_length_583_cov_0.826446_1_plen_42_part_10